MCQQNQEFFKADPSTDMWKAYVDYVDEMIVDGFFNTIHCSLQYMLNNTDVKLNPNPLYEARLELQVTVCVCVEREREAEAETQTDRELSLIHI